MGILVLDGGFYTTVQDFGRTGYQRFGVPVSGAMDAHAYAIANLLVDNFHGEAALEAAMLGPHLRFEQDNAIAITGADLSPTLNGAPVHMHRAVLVQKGDELSFGIQKQGCRAYIAFAGGLDVPQILGSRSTYARAGMGGLHGRSLKAGDRIGFCAPCAQLPDMAARVTEPPEYSLKIKTVRALTGPQDDLFTPNGIETFWGSDYVFMPESDRMGCRLDGPAIEPVGGIITDGVSPGAVQVPGGGKPIVMMADRQTTGGYAKIATVITVDLPILAQCLPGDVIRFARVDIDEAEALYLAGQRFYEALRKKIAAPAGGAPGDRLFEFRINGKTYFVSVADSERRPSQ